MTCPLYLESAEGCQDKGSGCKGMESNCNFPVVQMLCQRTCGLCKYVCYLTFITEGGVIYTVEAPVSGHLGNQRKCPLTELTAYENDSS